MKRPKQERTISPQELIELERLHQSTTQERWEAGLYRVFIRQEHAYLGMRIADVFRSDMSPLDARQENCDFAAMAHELVPVMIKEIRRLRAHLNPSAPKKAPEQ